MMDMTNMEVLIAMATLAICAVAAAMIKSWKLVAQALGVTARFLVMPLCTYNLVTIPTGYPARHRAQRKVLAA